MSKKTGGSQTHLFFKKERFSLAIFLIPSIIIIFVFNLFPAFYSFFLSFFNWNGFSPNKEFVGFNNYIMAFKDPELRNSIIVTLIYSSLVTFLSMIIGLLIALALNKDLKGKSLFRLLYFIPVVTPSVASGITWKYLFDPYNGVINKILGYFNINGPQWLNSTSWALFSVSIVGIWKRIGFCMVIYLAALQDIPKSYLEAAEVDGANVWHLFRYIKLPLLLPSSLFLIITGFIESFQVFDLIYTMTNGGPIGATDVLGFLLYRHAFKYFNLGYASVIALIIFVILFFLSIVQWKYTGGGVKNVA
ncbi:MAG TPA: sugar ABC transporter permease [Defluviitoga sp.]|nr:sugar ABC transporter permease [Defluviitoga sp.]HOP25133.1 sugar ABC transporter permease [Defluviitoga sp.]HPZ28807.1 sugar ABC transporter permease [Defluviitoga sp.]HQD62850.1 sugar ABC transporter permease [Defluviitoga sp.]